MGCKYTLLGHLCIRVNNFTIFISRYYILFVVAKGHSLHSVLVDVRASFIAKSLGVPSKDLSVRGTCYELLALFHELNSKERMLKSVHTLCYKLRARSLPIVTWTLVKIGVVELAVRLVGEDGGPIVFIKVELTVLPVIVFTSLPVVFLLLLVH